MLRRVVLATGAYGITTKFKTPGFKYSNIRFENQEEIYNNKIYDLVIIGAGTAGLAAAYSAREEGLSVAVINYVPPNYHGTVFGIGGTCPNVGCIPKYYFIKSAEIYQSEHLLSGLGFKTSEWSSKFSWSNLVKNVANINKSSAFKLKVSLKKAGIDHIPYYAEFKDQNTVSLIKNPSLKENTDKNVIVKGKYFLIASGERPSANFPIQGLRYGITHEEIFKLPEKPKRALVLSLRSIGTETISMLRGLGAETVGLHGTKFLQSYDKEIVDYLKKSFVDQGIKMEEDVTIDEIIEEKDTKKYSVVYKSANGVKKILDNFDIVVNCRGRRTNLGFLNGLPIEVNEDNNRIVGGFGGIDERTSIPNIFAAGDTLDKIPRNVPGGIFGARKVAKMVSELVRNPDNDLKPFTKSVYENMPCILYTIPEIGSIGLSEEKAVQSYGKEAIATKSLEKAGFLQNMGNLIGSFESDEYIPKKNLFKIVYLKKTGKILGLHMIGQNIEEILQGYAVRFYFNFSLLLIKVFIWKIYKKLFIFILQKLIIF